MFLVSWQGTVFRGHSIFDDLGQFWSMGCQYFFSCSLIGKPQVKCHSYQHHIEGSYIHSPRYPHKSLLICNLDIWLRIRVLHCSTAPLFPFNPVFSAGSHYVQSTSKDGCHASLPWRVQIYTMVLNSSCGRFGSVLLFIHLLLICLCVQLFV